LRDVIRPLLVLLAAGGGTRFDGPTHKLLAPFRGTTVLGAAVRAALDADAGPVLVVLGSLGEAEADLGGLPVEVRRNHRWTEGQATSLALAVDAADERGLDALVVGLGDQPLVGPDAWRTVAAAAGGPIVAASFGGERRPPVRLDRAVWPLLPRTGDDGARTVMRDHPELVATVAVAGEPVDIDTTDDLVRWS
jgi:CTP:molybdopterin cytidylyltransferase MocA